MDGVKQVLISEWQKASSVADLDHSSGPAERLWESCVEIYSGLLKIPKPDNVISAASRKKISRDLKLLLLWGDGLRSPDGGLDSIIQQSKRLRYETIRLLVSTATMLQSRVSWDN